MRIAEQLFSVTPKLLWYAETARRCYASPQEAVPGSLRGAPSGERVIKDVILPFWIVESPLKKVSSSTASGIKMKCLFVFGWVKYVYYWVLQQFPVMHNLLLFWFSWIELCLDTCFATNRKRILCYIFMFSHFTTMNQPSMLFYLNEDWVVVNYLLCRK